MSAMHRPVDGAASPFGGLSLRGGWRRVSVLALLFALTSQMVLPLAHASAGSARAASVVAHLHVPAHGTLSAHAAAPASHDPATCVTCQSLLHANPAAAPPALLEAWLPELCAPIVACAAPSHAAVSRTGNPPRAPPRGTLSLG